MNSVATLTDLTPAQRLELLKMARARKLVGDRPELPPIEPAAREGRPPLSFAQERLWFIDRLEPGSAVYNLPAVAWRPGGALDEAALERSLSEIVRRHEALRTVFAEVDGSPVQVIEPFGGFSLPVEDLSGEADPEAAFRRREGEEARRAFDLSAGPLFRASLLRLGAESHVLLLSMHHIVGDGWSLGVLQRELGALYAAYREGRESPLPELPVQYADYAVWQREQLAGEVLDRQLAYWRDRLSGAPELLELPTDRPRPPVQTYRGATVPVELSPELLERLQALGRSEGATLYMTLLAAFQVLLSKYSGSDDIVVGSPIAGRTRREVEGLIGFFVNTLVLRTDLSGDPSFREVLRRVRDFTLGAYEHQDVPFEKLVAELQPERSLSHSPLFQVMFTLQNAGGREGALAAHEVGGADAPLEIAKYDLSLTLAPTPHGLRGGLNYSTDLFERATAERMLGHLARVLEQVAADAEVSLSRLALTGPEERARVVVEWNRTERPYPRGVCIHELFDAQVRERPGAVALAWGGVELTYRELDARANQLAHHLVRLGVGPDARVGVLLERSAELIVSVLAVLKAGGCYVPLDPGYPPERLRLMLADSDARVLLSRSELAGVVEAGDLGVVHLDQAAGALASEPVEAPLGGATAENLAYIVYTSGSTGKPKGVMVAHRHVVQLVVETDYVRFRPGDRVAQASNASFDALTFEAWGALLNGATLVGIPRDVLLSPPALHRMLREERITTLYQTTALLNQLSREQPDVFAPLREVLFGGQAVDADSVRRLLKAGGPQRLLHMYGPTETTAWCSWEQVTHVAEDALTVSVGRPTGNQRIYLLDAALNPVPVGVPGEGYVGGDGVVRGYLERPGLTAERFVPDPFAAEPGARMYRTGDRLRWRADGRLEFIGRVDEQVKVRGFRIEPGEIEATLTAHADVHEARVIVREDEPGEQRLVAYVVGKAEADALREHLRLSLPEYMVPGAFVALERIPLTPNGKLDRKALPAPDLAPAEDRYVAPRTPTEEVLAGIWAEVLRLERTGVTESFFELGGHSLLATRVVSRVRELFGVELPLRALFEGPTVAELAVRVEEMRRAELPVLPPVVPVERTAPLPLSFAQERLWFIDQLEPGSAVYNIPGAWRLAGPLDGAALERSLSEIVRRHEALRTVFAEADGSPVQVIAPFDGFALPVDDLSALSEADREAAVRGCAGEEARRAFDLSAGPLFRAALLRLGAEEHVLLLSMHHIVSDGWSMGVLFRELSVLYEAYREGRESPLPELPVQYADYAVWQREQLAGEALDRQLAYWKERLADAPALLELPADHPRPAVQTHRGATVPVELSPELLERLQALGRSEGATLYMTLLGAFQVLLSKYSGSDDIVVGSPIAGRTRKEIEELIGFFVNTVVLRTDLSGDPSFRELLGRVREGTLGAYAHQEVPFEKLVAELQPERSLSHAPLFQVLFTLQDAGGGGGALPRLKVGSVGAAMEIAKFDLSLTLAATPQGLRGGLNYSTDLFERASVERMLGHLERVLEQVAADADVRLSQLELLAKAERSLVLEAWNRTDAEYPAGACIHELFEAQAERTPGAVAVVFEGAARTYDELNRSANRLAHHLRGLGVGPDARVGVCVERGPEMIVGLLAILKAGGAYLPLDPAYPADRLRYMLEDSAPAALVTQSSLAGTFAGVDVPVVELDAPAPAWAEGPETNPARAGLTPGHLAYVIYTSGSTGRPKGVMVEHRSLVNHTAWQAAAFGIGARDTVLQRTSISFDASVWELWTPLATGARMLLLSSAAAKDPDAIGRVIGEGEVTVAQFVPTLLQAVLGARPAGTPLRCRILFCGGEPLPAALVEEARAAGAGEVVNLYGPTEATIDSTWHPCSAGDGRAPAIGRPIANARIYVLDARGEPAPVGVAGELYVGGAGVARGYLGRAGLTAERFVPDPFSRGAGARLYRTGDLGRWRADGTLEFLGRTDFQVKIRGFRVELGEIEAALREHEGVRECAVLVRGDAGETRVVAYVVGEVETDALRAHVRRSLPEYMVPAAFVALDRLPLTPNGKLDRKALPAPEFASAEARYVAPRTPTEEVLAGIWAEVLRLERAGVTESFFELGGHSLLATRVVSRVRELFGVELPLRALFEGPTVAELAVRVEEVRRAGLPVLPPVVPAERTGALPLSFAQERLWFIDRLERGSTAYNLSGAWRLGGALDQAALERSLGEIVRRHEALRTTFGEVDGSPVQVIAPFGAFDLPVEDLSGLGEADREAAARRRAGEEAAWPFDLAAGPLFRAALLRLGDEDHVLLLSMHHIVSDGWSMGVLFRELSALYAAYSEGRESPLAEPAVQYADYAVWQREQLAGEVLERQLSYWRAHLAGAPELLELPTDHPRPAVQTFRGAAVPVDLSLELLERLQALGRSEGATLYMTLLGAFQVLLGRYGGSEDVVVGSPIAGRTRGEIEELIGFFVNTLVLRADLSGDPSFRETLRRVREATLGAYEHQEVPFEKLVAELQPERSLSHSPLFQVMFTLQDAGGGGDALPGLKVGGVGAAMEIAKFDLSLTLAATPQGLRGGLNYSTDLFERGTIERMLGHLARVLEQAAARPEARLSELDLLSAEERRLVVDAWNRTAAGYPADRCIHELFEEQAARTPGAAAVRFEEESLTRGELNERANRLAHHLTGLGVRPETRVAICLERGPEMVVSILAVLKAGGAYVPLDPAYPAERLAFMLADAAVPVLVTQESLRAALSVGDGVAVVSVDGDGDSIAAQSAENPQRGVSPGHLAYVIYTSGSTGTPKGVLVQHGSLANLLAATREAFGVGEGDVMPALASYAFDIWLFEALLPLTSGAAVRLVGRERVLDVPALVAEIADATLLHAVPALMRQVVHVERETPRLVRLRRAFVGGDRVAADLLAEMREALPGAETHVLYGPTEGTILASTYPVPADGIVAGHPIGRPLGNVRLYVCDGLGSPQPAGVPGELLIGGAGVARGYLGRAAMTAERFVPDPFGTEPGARLYRTGDRARWRTDGTLEYLGRLDGQVKIRGFRIEPGEVEAVLRGHEGVTECVVVAREDVPGDQRLVAYVAGGAEAGELREHLKARLPEHMMPSAFVVLEALPLTPNGKLDRKALPAPDFASAEDRYVAPRTPTEEVLAGIWAEVLRLERVGVEESFFELGGHSLLATRVAARVREVFGVELPLRAVFERPVVSGLAAEIERLRGTGAAAVEGAIAPAPREGDLPVTFAQERLWFVDALDPGSPVYAMPFSYHVAGRLDDDALRRALAELVRRHEPLRTTLPAMDGVPVQRIAPPPASFDLPVADLRHLPGDERRAEAGRLTAEASQHRFDLARGPLFRASLVRVADDQHLLLLNLHHAIGDGWSLGVLKEELSALYGAFSRGEASPLPEPALQYADYAVWQRERLSGAALERQVEFWRRALEGAPALLELPTDRPRPPVESHRGALERLVVSSELAAEVHALARREGATLFMVLLAALDVVLGRLAGQEDVVVGTPIAGRTRAETDRMVGLFLNSLALRTDLSGDPSFRELLGRVRETTLAAYGHQDLPFERVLEEVRPERSLAHAPVFQVMLNLANFQEGAFRAEGLEVAGAGSGGELASKFDLTLYVGEQDGGIDVTLVYAADLFDAPRMRGLLAQLEGVLRQAAAAPETRVGALSLATEAARGVLPDPARPIEAEAWSGAVHETFAAHVAKSPEALAISDSAETWTYCELDAAANRVAHRLIDGGVRPGDVVAVYAHRSAALVRALLGAWKAGAAFAVLDPAYPPGRLAAQARAARPTALLRISAAGEVPAEVAAALAESARLTVVLTADGKDGGDGFPSAAPDVSVGPDDLAYVAFTSGTTGTPKAIAGTHRPLAHFFGWSAREMGIGAKDRFSLLSGLAHDPLLRDVFAPLAVGGSIAIPDPDQVGTPGWLAGWMREEGITVAHLTPAMGQVLATGPGDARLPALRLACFGGDVLRATDVARLRAIAPNADAVNFYGATETPQAMGIFRLPADLAEVGPAVPVGRGIDGVDLLVVTSSGTLAGIGELGEIAVRTPYLSRGYLNDAELTAARFVPNPWTGQPRDRLYRTGDLGRYRPDGAVEPAGRADQQVKVRGFRVELGEVESALASHPAIRAAAVIAREIGAGDRGLVAYWVPVEGAVEPDAAALRAHLKALLPEYMVPSAYVRLDRLPLTANGKLDRRALPEPEAAANESRPAAPRTPTEEILAQIWAEVLRLDSVGVDDDFFALGGHSLLATRLLARVQNALGVVLPLRAVFEGPTVAQLAARVEEVRRAGLPVLPPVVPVDRDRPLPLSFAQERLWFLDRLEGGSAAYNIPNAVRLGGALDVGALERSLGEIVRRHESLRTFFREVDGGPVQVIAPFAGFALPVDDLSGLDETARAAEVRRRAGEEASRPFDLSAGPLFRASLLRLGSEEHVLLLCIHHIITDGWSSGVLLRELSALYAAYREGGESPLAELPVQYADYAVWQREQLRGEALDRQVGYWTERLAGAPALLELPTDRPRPPVQSHRGAREAFGLPRALLDRLQALGRSEGATLYMVMLSAFQLLLSKYSGSDDIVVGSPIAGRTRKEVEELIGFFANTLVLRTDLSGDPSFRELLGRVREGTLGAYEHQEVPFERLVAELQPERSLSHAPLFQVMFILQNADRSGSGLAGLRMEGVAAEVETARFDLSLTAAPHDDGIGGVLEYSTDLFDRSTVRRMLGHLERVLEQVAADADVRLSRLELLSAEERGLVVDAWNGTAAEYPSESCVHELFEAQVEHTPDATAVRFGDERLSYAELNARANRLAHELRSRGVGPEVRVALCVERGPGMVAAVLAVLKAGGAYVPLDPSYPVDRLRYMLADSAPAIVLTQRAVAEALAGVLDGLGAGVPVLELDAAAPAWASRPATDPARGGLTPEHPAYVIYTSGSTGRPKGVLVPHRGLCNVAAAQQRVFGLGPDDRVLQFASLSFDGAAFELLIPLTSGAALCVAPREELLPGPGLLALLRRHEVTMVLLPPSALAVLPVEDLPALRTIGTAGEALPAELVGRWGAGRRLWNLYGPTEATIWSTAAECADPARKPDIGAPIPNVRACVLGAALEPLPVGVPGELYVGGAGVARGYLGRPALTAERFVPDPFSAVPGARLYRTGDRVRWLADGRLDFIGRVDHQVKVRGFRIEPGEIEAVLSAHPGVREAVVLVREDAPGAKRLVAYVAGDETAGADALRAHLSERLPDYMVPAAYVRLDALPLTPNGKVDRKALPAPEGDAFGVRGYEAPSGKVEGALAAIWADLLGVERVGRHDDFFQLGGNSLLATRLVFRIRREMDVELSVRDIFEKPELSLLAQYVLDAQLAQFDPNQIEALLALVRAADAG